MISKPTGILTRRTPAGRTEFFYPVAHDLWHPRNSKDTYVAIDAAEAVEIVTLTDEDVLSGGYRPAHFYGDDGDDVHIWIDPETLLKHMRLIALVLARAEKTAR